MAFNPAIPNVKVPVLDNDGSLALPWRRYLQTLTANGGTITPADLAALEALIAALEVAVAKAQADASKALSELETALADAQGALALSVSSLDAGTVQSVGLSAPSIFTVSGSPVTSYGTLTFTLNTQNANLFFAGPASGSPAIPTFRVATLASADFANQGTVHTVLHGNASGNPAWSAVDLTADVTGTLPVGNGGTGQTSFTAHGVLIGAGGSALSVTGTGTSGQVLTSNGSGADPTFQPASSGAVSLISEVVTAGSQASVTFSSIPATYRDLIIRIRGRGDTAATVVNALVQFNADTGANYDDYYPQSNNGAIGTGGANISTTSLFIGYLEAATAVANFATGAEVILYDYRGTTFFKNLSGQGSAQLAAAVSAMYVVWPSGYWKSTAAINAIKVFLSAGNFVNDSVVSLYGSL